MGIDTEPVPITIVLDHKYDEDGELKKLKCRIAVRGTQKYMQPGTHYDPNTYAATPNMNSTRILMALVALYGLFQKCFDITKAYTWAELDKKDLLILKYPKHFERYDTKTHEPLYMIMRRNLYGTPNAARNYTQKRDKFILTYFNTDGWACTRSRMDPCFFLIIRDGLRSWMLIHTDDCDLASESKLHTEMIFTAMHNEWPCKEVPHTYMLGVKRTLTVHEDGNRTLTMSMESYIEAMYETFKEFIPTKHQSTPMM